MSFNDKLLVTGGTPDLKQASAEELASLEATW